MSEASTYTSIYQVLEQVCFARSVPAGTRGAVYSAIDSLRGAAAPSDHIAVAERIAVALHKLEWALADGDEESITDVQRELPLAGSEWLQTPMRRALH